MIDQIDDPRFGQAIRIADDDAGLADPRSLFSLGRSEWSKSLSLSEDAAGMGFFSLANRGAMIVAGQQGTGQAWTIAATPDAFHGQGTGHGRRRSRWPSRLDRDLPGKEG
ncbi:MULTISPECIES: hypothetical protein [unclassified Shinella]|uniref:hypothetical protein n=1 Tax=unclassified Shinella TaxID=2643062 RepID=UPI00234F543F|nr:MULTISPECIES: hypothetical protein [unclassified Shinella]MCO5148535.1 hypothetical protein [Shinella sp.]MDC7264604.1 hypothetical protein [Shinella sp. HY16]MDC7271501.1 hypothetical protein [Shinella sp. YZ44]